MLNMSFGRRLRVRRLYRRQPGRLLVVPLDHSVTDGPITGGRRVNRLVGQIAQGGADAVVLHKGALRYVDPAWFQEMGLIVHLSASTNHAGDPDEKYLVAGVEEAISLGADAVSVHVNLGSRAEAHQVRDLAHVADGAERFNVPLLAMMYPRGPQMPKRAVLEHLAHAAVLAADLGADVVKLPRPASPDDLAQVTAISPIPVVLAGGTRTTGRDLHQVAVDALHGGAVGLASGRSVFEADDPCSVVADLASVIHATADSPSAISA